MAQRQTDPRKRMIGAVHAAAAKRGLDDDTRRDLMERTVSKRSCADMTIAELGRVLDAIHGSASRAAVRQGRPADRSVSEDSQASGRERRRPGTDQDHAAWRRKALALWISAHQLGLVRDPSDRALDRFVARQARVDSVRWLPPEKAGAVIEALKDWLAREGGVDWRWPPGADDRERIALALFRRLGEAGVASGDPHALEGYCARLLGLSGSRRLDPAEWGRALPLLAVKLAHAEGRAE